MLPTGEHLNWPSRAQPLPRSPSLSANNNKLAKIQTQIMSIKTNCQLETHIKNHINYK